MEYPKYAPDISIRSDYNQAETDKHEASITLTNIMDGMLASDGNEELLAQTKVSEDFYQIKRGFRIAERDTSGYNDTPVEKILCLTYTDDRTSAAREERYDVFLVTSVKREESIDTPIITRYVIRYFGRNRTTSIATIETPDFTSKSLNGTTTCHVTPYDQTQLFDELMRFEAFMDTTAGNETS